MRVTIITGYGEFSFYFRQLLSWTAIFINLIITYIVLKVNYYRLKIFFGNQIFLANKEYNIYEMTKFGGKMKSDFELIKWKFPEELEYMNIYSLGDLHIGSEQFRYDTWQKWKKAVCEDKNGFVVMVGDLMDMGLKTSKTNSYEATMSPHEQKEWLYCELKDMKEKILGGTQGNHEYRLNIASDTCPLYDVMARLQLEDLYRRNMAFVKVNFGKKNKERQYSYVLSMAHGASKNKTDKFKYTLEGVDVLFTGHIHDAGNSFPAKIVVDSHNEVVRQVGYKHVVVPSFLEYGGYAMRAMYLPVDGSIFPVVKLSGTEKKVEILWK